MRSSHQMRYDNAMTTVMLIHRFLTSLGFTVIVETAILFLLLRFIFKKQQLQTPQIIAAGLFASFATLPYVWFVFPYVWHWPGSAVYWSESFAFIVEAIFYRLFLKLDWKVAFIVSLICNAGSFLLGPLLRSHGLWIYW